MPDVRNILFIKWKSMGDVVFTLPAIGLLRANFPQAKITYLTSLENEPIACCFTDVDEVWSVDRGVFKRGNPLAIGSVTADMVRRMRRGRFSLVIDTQCYTETAVLTWLTGAPRRWGYQLGRRLRRFAYTHSLPRPVAHPVDMNLEMLAHFGVTKMPYRCKLCLPEKGEKEANQFLAEHGVRLGAAILFIQPFTSSWHKDWPFEKQLVVAKHWQSKGVQVIFGGGPKEREALKPAIDAGFPVCAGLPLMAVARIMERASVVLGADTGLLHLAQAMGKPIRMLFRPVGAGSTGPYGRPEWIIPPPADGIVPDISVEAVNEALGEILATASNR